MSLIIIHDERVHVPTPQSTRRYLVNQGTNLYNTIESIARDLQSDFEGTNVYMNELHILCHGLPMGLQLGNDYVNHNNVTVFRPIAGLFGTIFIHGCSAALVYPNGSNGVVLCSRLARIARASVIASESEQYVYNGNAMQSRTNESYFMPWNGRVGTWFSNGRLGRVRTYNDPRVGESSY